MSDAQRRVLREQSPARQNALARIRLVPSTPPKLLGTATRPTSAHAPERRDDDEVYSRTPLPTRPCHVLDPPTGNDGVGQGHGQGARPLACPSPSLPSPLSDERFHRPQATGGRRQPDVSPSSSPQLAPLPPRRPSPSRLATLPKKPSRKRLQVHSDQKTFSLLPVQDNAHREDEGARSPASLGSASPTEEELLDSSPLDPAGAAAEANSTTRCPPEPSSPEIPATPPPAVSKNKKPPLSALNINTSPPDDYRLVGGLRKVPKTPDSKQGTATTASADRSLPPLPVTSAVPQSPASRHLSAQPSFQSTDTRTTSSENTNYKVYGASSPSTSELALASPSSSASNYHVLAPSSPAGSVIYRPQTATSENDNSDLYRDILVANSYVDLAPPGTYSQESLVVPPLRPAVRSRPSVETLGYFKSRSRETLRSTYLARSGSLARSASLASISTVLSQPDLLRTIGGPSSLLRRPQPALRHTRAASSWAEPPVHPPRPHMQETPHVWSSQLSTVLSESEGGTDRNSRSWCSDNGRRSSGYPSIHSRNSRHVLSISSSPALESEFSSRSRSVSLDRPAPAFMRHRPYNSDASVPIAEDGDEEYGDVVTDMQDLPSRPLRRRLSEYFSSASSENGRSMTMRSETSSMTNSSQSPHAIPIWARLYYGSGERQYLRTPGGSIADSHSRNNSTRSVSGSPNPDYFSQNINSPRRRPRTENASVGGLARRPTEVNPVQHDPAERTRGFRSWSMSSVWSPHLRVDRRATHPGAWNPPSLNWSIESGIWGRKNVQIVMFILGFIFPFGMFLRHLLRVEPSRRVQG